MIKLIRDILKNSLVVAAGSALFAIPGAAMGKVGYAENVENYIPESEEELNQGYNSNAELFMPFSVYYNLITNNKIASITLTPIPKDIMEDLGQEYFDDYFSEGKFKENLSKKEIELSEQIFKFISDNVKFYSQPRTTYKIDPQKSILQNALNFFDSRKSVKFRDGR